MRILLAFCLSLSLFADQPVVSYSRFCATCGILGADTIVSQSGQYIIHGTDRTVFAPIQAANAPALTEMEPQLVAVTAERVKKIFLEDLNISDTYRDKIHVLVLNRARPDQPIGLVSAVQTDGFQYQLGLPAFLQSSRMTKALVQAVLQEYANRGGHRNAELPSWLVEGMHRHVMTSLVPAAVTNRKPLTVDRKGYDRLGDTRTFFQTNNPITIQDLSFNNLAALSPLQRQNYECSAHLLVHELLRLRGGPALLSQFIQSLPAALNWQTAFFSVYRQFFHTPLDLEKWWMLTSVEIKNREARQTWNSSISLERLDWLLRTTTEQRLSSNSIPQKREATLQELLTALDFSLQKELLGQKLQQIFFLSVNLSPEVASLAGGYQQAIESYLQKRALNDYQPSLRSDPEVRLQLLVQSTINTLNELDQAREDIRAGRKPKLAPPPPKKPGRQIIVTRESSRK